MGTGGDEAHSMSASANGSLPDDFHESHRHAAVYERASRMSNPLAQTPRRIRVGCRDVGVG